MTVERTKTLKKTTRRQRGGMLIEAMVAVVILTIAFLAWAGCMMGASQGQYHAARHTETIEIANYLMEQTRRDSEFWGGSANGGEFLGVGNCSGNNCWTSATANVPTDGCGNAFPPLLDNGPTNGGTWHTGCQNMTLEGGATINTPYQFQWRADLHAKGAPAEDDSAADITVWVRAQTLHGGWDQYVVSGLNREPRQ